MPGPTLRESTASRSLQDAVADQSCARMLLLAADDPSRDVHLYVDSPGGSVTAGMAAWDTVQSTGCDVATYAFGMAASMGQFAAGTELPQPRSLVLLAPWLDLTLADPAVAAAEARDPWLSSVGPAEVGRAWAGRDDPRDPRLSPVSGPLAGLSPVRIWVGTRDLLLPDGLTPGR